MSIEDAGKSEPAGPVGSPLRTGRAVMRWRWMSPVVKAAFGFAGLLGVVLAFGNAWASRGPMFPAPAALAVAFILSLATLLSAPLAWVALIGTRADRRRLIRGYYAALLGRYIPGGVWQAIGQVGFARNAGVGWAEAATAFVVQSFTQLSAGAVIGVGVVFSEAAVPGSVRTVALACLLFVATLSRRWILFAMRHTGRPLDGSVQVPEQRGILLAFAWSVLSVSLGGLAFWVLLSSLLPEIGPWSAVPAFAFAWSIGFIAVVFPSGIGVREAVLVVALGAPAGPVLAASLAQRIVGIVAEVSAVLFSRRLS